MQIPLEILLLAVVLHLTGLLGLTGRGVQLKEGFLQLPSCKHWVSQNLPLGDQLCYYKCNFYAQQTYICLELCIQLTSKLMYYIVKLYLQLAMETI